MHVRKAHKMKQLHALMAVISTQYLTTLTTLCFFSMHHVTLCQQFLPSIDAWPTSVILSLLTRREMHFFNET